MRNFRIVLLCLLSLLSDVCMSNPTESTITSRNERRALQTEFVKAMDQALGKSSQKQESFLSRLAQLATPATSQSPFPGTTARNLEDNYQNYGINLTEYALKYVGCSQIKTWSDDMAESDEYATVLKTDRFVVLRLCPRESCSNYNEYGCLEQFGDYLLPMETYLQVMAETFFTQYQEYCETCYQCSYNNNNNNGNNNNNYYNNDDANANNNGDDYYANNNNNNNNNGNRRLNNDDGNNWYNYNNWYNNNGDDNANDDGSNYNYYQNNNNNNNNNQGCDFWNVCENYQSACQEYTNLAFDLQDYFQCAEFNIGDSVGYMGPHCRNDGKTISMGIFSDENCYEFSGADLQDMSSYVQVSDTDLAAYYSSNCISCLASDGYTLEVDNNGDGYADVSDICGELYGYAAKCNKYLGNSGDYSSSNQEKQEKTVCNFIENLLTNSYDEYGEIVLQQDDWTAYIPDIGRMPNWQKYTVASSVILTVGLFAYACYLHREITQRKFVWYPRGRKGYSNHHPGMAPKAIGGRMHSGIIQGRSRSSSDFEMKDGGILS